MAMANSKRHNPHATTTVCIVEEEVPRQPGALNISTYGGPLINILGTVIRINYIGGLPFPEHQLCHLHR
jgi:hypothetical protein